MFVLKWAWRHYSLYADDYDDLDDAVRAAGFMSDQGDEALDCIEVWEDDGSYRRLTKNEVWELNRAQEDAAAAARPPEPPTVATVDIVHPEGGEDARVGWYKDHASADAEVARLAAIVGPERVRKSTPRM